METVTKTVIYAVLQIPRKSELGSVGSKVAKAKKNGICFHYYQGRAIHVSLEKQCNTCFLCLKTLLQGIQR